MSNLVALFGTSSAVALPSYLTSGTDGATNALNAGLGGESRNRIGLKGSRFRLVQGGVEVAIKDEPYLDVIILAANAAISRTFYMGKYDPSKKDKPACYSPDGVAPAKDAQAAQSAKCATCKQNEKGSVIRDDGSKGRACAFSKRIAVTLAGDKDQEIYQLDVKAMSLFGDGVPSKGLYTLSEYAKLLASRGARAEGLVTRISFDTEESVPKLYFTPQAFLPEVEFNVMAKLAKSDEVKKLITVDSQSIDLSNEVEFNTPDVPAPRPVLAAPAPKPVPVVVEAVAEVEVEEEVAPPAPAPAPVAAKKAKPAPVAAPAPVEASAMDDDLESMLDGLM